MEAYHGNTEEEREAAALRSDDPNTTTNKQQWAGIKQEEKMLDWIHNCFFAAVAGDAPSFEAWPSNAGMRCLKNCKATDFGPWCLTANLRVGYVLHEFVLAGWGVPIGEMWDLEKLAEKCKERNRWIFFMTSAPANVKGKCFILLISYLERG